MFYTARLENWYPDETPQRVYLNARFVVPTQDDEYGVVIRLRNGTNFVMADEDDHGC